jgi:hypothetical protein
LKIHGNRIQLDDVESFLNSWGIPCACGGKDDLLAIAVLEGQDVNHVRTLVGKKYAFHASVLQVWTVSGIPVNKSGKILYSEIFKNFGNVS